MQPGPCISVIVPMYNAQATLPRAVGAILSQTMPDFELLLVDDGSTDGTVALADRFAARDARVRVLRQQNAGICAARNHGLRAARGEYLTFCDDDDELLPDALQTALSLARQSGADITRTGYRLLRQRQDGAWGELPHPPGVACTLAKDAPGAEYLRFLQNSGPQFVWNALYRRAALGEVRFDGRCRRGLEDFIFNASVYATGASAVFSPTVTYRHEERAQSTSSCASVPVVEERIQALPLWVEAEAAALRRHCGGDLPAALWNARKAEFITFLMHQLRGCRANGRVCRRSYAVLRRALAHRPHTVLDILRLTGQNRKQMAAVLLYTLHLQWLYPLLPNKEKDL